MSIELLGEDTSEETLDFNASLVNEHLAIDAGKGGFRGEWKHDKSASSAYWDPRGRSIVSTSYDDTIRCMPDLYFWMNAPVNCFFSVGYTLPSIQKRCSVSKHETFLPDST